MVDQTFKNHTRIVPVWHVVISLLILGGLVGAVVNLIDSWHNPNNLYSASLILLVMVVLLMFYVFIRSFPLKAQDRAIRAEENLRHYVLTGKLLDSRLRMGQVVALRFAPDDEFPALVHQAAEQNMPPKEIKKAIRNWKGDYYRI